MSNKEKENGVVFTVNDVEHVFHSTDELDDFVGEKIEDMIEFLNEASEVREELEEHDVRKMFEETYKKSGKKEEEDEEEEEDEKEDVLNNFCDFMRKVIDDFENMNSK